MKKVAFVFMTFVCCVLIMGAAIGTAPVLPTKGFYVNDYADVLGQERRDFMLSTARSVYEITGAQIVLLTVESLGGRNPEEYALLVFEDWEIGGPEQAGVLMLVATGDEEAYILVGQGLSEALPENVITRVRDERLVVGDENGEYSEGIYEGFKDVVTAVFADYGAEASFEEENSRSAKDFGMYAICVGMGFLILIRAFRIGKRANKRVVRGPVYKRTVYKPESRPDEDDYPSGFGGAVTVKVRKPEAADNAEENRTGGDEKQ